MNTLTAAELKTKIDTNSENLFLLDVREPHEFEHCHISGSILIPMQTIPQRLADIPKDKTVISICHHGMRSLQVAQFLLGQGFNNIINLSGGVNAWAQEVDSTMPRY